MSRGPINLAVLYLHEKGELKRLENKWWYDRAACVATISVRFLFFLFQHQQTAHDGDADSLSLNLSKVAGIFYILTSGMVLALITSLIEFIYRRHKEKNGRAKVRRPVKRERMRLQLNRLSLPPLRVKAMSSGHMPPRRSHSEESRRPSSQLGTLF